MSVTRRRAVPTLAFGLAAILTTCAPPARAASYTFSDIDAPVAPGAVSMGTTVNAISNTGAVTGFSQDTGGNFYNFVRSPGGSFTSLNPSLTTGTAANANGINSAGTVVGMDNVGGNDVAFSLTGTTETVLPTAGGNTPTVAFGINDSGLITGQFANMAGFVDSGGTYTTIPIPATFTSINVQDINNNGLAVGFYTQGAVSHGFTYNYVTKTFTSLADPNTSGVTVPSFLFSQVLGINDLGIASGYYGTTTDLQHGFLYNTNTNTYTFLDDPNVTPGGSPIMQITGINNAGTLSGFYTDAQGVQHGFLARPNAAVPEPATPALLALGLLPLGLRARRRAAR